MAAASTSASSPPHLKPPDPNQSPPPIAQRSHALPPQPAKDNSLSFATMAAKAPVLDRYPDVPLPARQYGQKEGVPAVTFSASEHQALTQRIRHTVIAKFQNSRPQLSVIKAFVESHWRLKGRVTISSNWDARHVVFMLDSEDDVNQALVCPHRKIQHAYFRLFRWSADYNPKKETTRVTKWIKLPGLPMEFFTKSSVKAIVSSFAHFLDIDDRTHSMNSLQCARACVELDIMKQIPSQVWISVGDKSFYQDIVVEGGIAYCMKCKIHGHNVETCRKALKIIEQTKNDKVDDEKKNATVDETKSTAAGKTNSRNEWTVVQHKRKAVRHPIPSKENSKNIAVTSTGLIALQDMIDNTMTLPPHKPPEGVEKDAQADGEKDKDTSTDVVLPIELNAGCNDKNMQVDESSPMVHENIQQCVEGILAKKNERQQPVLTENTTRPNVLVPKSTIDVSSSTTASLLLGNRNFFQVVDVKNQDNKIDQVTEDNSKSSKSDV